MSQLPHTVAKSTLSMGHRQSRYNIKLLFYQCNRKHHLEFQEKPSIVIVCLCSSLQFAFIFINSNPKCKPLC